MQSILKKPGPLVMGILNVTPDSFSDGGLFLDKDLAVQRAEKMIAEGADVIDIGGESTRPGAAPVTETEELDRVIPLIEALNALDIAISVDTSKAIVMQEAISAGASMINDVRALQEEGALDLVASSKVEVCLMHMQGQPRTMQDAPQYNDVVSDVVDFFKERLVTCVNKGIDKSRICFDPGIGFGKNLAHNCQLLQELPKLLIDEMPLLIGVSRKRMFNEILNLPVEERMLASVSAGLLAVSKGAKILRVHDVKETKQAIEVYKAIEQKH